MISWADMKALMHGKEASSCWFPAAPVKHMEIGNNITVRVHEGEPAYQLSTGEIVRVTNMAEEGA